MLKMLTTSAKANPISKQKKVNTQILSKYCANSVENHMREKKKNVQRTARDVTCVMEQTTSKQYATTCLRSHHI